MWSRNLLISSGIIRYSYRTSSKFAVEINPAIQQQLENAEIKPQHHPGRCRTGNIHIPSYVIKGLTRAIGDYPVKTLLRDSETLNKTLTSRHPPVEEIEIRKKLFSIKKEVKESSAIPDANESLLSEPELDKLRNQQSQKIRRTLKERIYAWRPMSYGHYEALLYALARGTMEYAILYKIFSEIMRRDPHFKPRSYFDFGSGIGSGMWATTHFWKDTIFEYFNVDSSRDMNELSDLILREGNENQQSKLKNVFYRQFLPASETKYDLIVSSFSLFELSNEQTRKETMLNLWKKCDGYLVIVDQGSRAGFKLVTEARDFILGLEQPLLKGFVFSPCPHDLACPRITNERDRTPCNFEISYDTFPIGAKITRRTDTYSYVVLKRGHKDVNSPTNDWPRIVRDTLVRKKHTVCRLCTAQGNLQEVIFTAAKHGKLAYRCARSSNWGDRLPIKLEENQKILELSKNSSTLESTEEK